MGEIIFELHSWFGVGLPLVSKGQTQDRMVPPLHPEIQIPSRSVARQLDCHPVSVGCLVSGATGGREDDSEESNEWVAG